MRYIVFATLAVCAVFGCYVLNFGIAQSLPVSADTTVWNNFGGYVGGVLGPILTFINVFYLVRTFNSSKKNDQLNLFSTLFFNMIEAQQNLIKEFEISFIHNNTLIVKQGTKAVIDLEDDIQYMRDLHASDAMVRSYIEYYDYNNQIFGIVRAFYVSVKMVSQRLDNENGFSTREREEMLGTLINFMDFAQIRLVLMGVQFIECAAADYLRSNEDLRRVMIDVGLTFDPY